MPNVYETLRGLLRGDMSVLNVQAPFFRYEYHIPGSGGMVRVGVSAWPDWYGEDGKSEASIACDIYKTEQHQGTPWPQIVDAVDRSNGDGTFSVFLDVEGWKRHEAENVRDAFTDALQRHGCWENEESASRPVWIRENE